jgi:hypothetical protein
MHELYGGGRSYHGYAKIQSKCISENHLKKLANRTSSASTSSLQQPHFSARSSTLKTAANWSEITGRTSLHLTDATRSSIFRMFINRNSRTFIGSLPSLIARGTLCDPLPELHDIRCLSTAGGLYNVKKIRREPKIVIQSKSSEEKPEYSSKFVKAEVLDYSINLRNSRPGTEIKVPYELTLTESLSDFWQSSFHSQDRVHTSTPFARALGLQDRVMPFSLVLFLTSAMSHEDAAKVQVGFGKCIYCWPVFAGDTVRKTFKVKSIRNTSDGNHSVSLQLCVLFIWCSCTYRVDTLHSHSKDLQL